MHDDLITKAIRENMEARKNKQKFQNNNEPVSIIEDQMAEDDISEPVIGDQSPKEPAGDQEG